jgi:hypothetical protein
MEKAKKKNNSAPNDVPISNAVPEVSKPRAGETGIFLALIGLAFTGFIALEQANGVVTVRWLPSLIGYFLLTSLSLWSFWQWEVIKGWRKRNRVIALIIFGLILASASAFGVGTQYHRDHPRSVTIIGAVATNVSHPKGEKVGGIEWQDDYGELLVNIQNGAEESISNVDLAVQVLDEGVIHDMGQLSTIPVCEFHPPDYAELDNEGVRILDKTGGASIFLTSRYGWELGGKKVPDFSNQWTFFCPRLARKAELRLILATSANKNGAIPKKVRVFGRYDVASDEGNITVKIDTTVNVKR